MYNTGISDHSDTKYIYIHNSDMYIEYTIIYNTFLHIMHRDFARNPHIIHRNEITAVSIKI